MDTYMKLTPIQGPQYKCLQVMSHGVCSRSQDGLCIWKHSRLGGGVEDQVGERDHYLATTGWCPAACLFTFACRFFALLSLLITDFCGFFVSGFCL